MWSTLGSALLDAWAVLAPTECAGCGAPDRALCAACRAELTAAVPVRGALRRDDGSELPLWHAFDYEGTARSVLIAFKDGGRTDAAPGLAGTLRRLVRAALAESTPSGRGRVELAAIPSSRAAYRRRGYAQLRLLLARAGYRDSRLLRATRPTRDQAELNITERHANRESSLAVRDTSDARVVLIIDDIVTTGATVLDADRAFRKAGFQVLGVVALARTKRLSRGWEPVPKSEEIARDIARGSDYLGRT